MTTIEFTPAGDFSLRASTQFLEDFAPARYRGGADGDARMRLAFPVEGSWRSVGVLVSQAAPDGPVRADVPGPVEAGLRAQVSRILSLDVDGGGLAEVCERDAVVDHLVAMDPGLRPVCFHSPYEAACWAVIAQRTRVTAAARVKERIAERYGDRLTVDGVELAAFPSPHRLLEVVGELPLPVVKRERLRGVAVAALSGELDAAHLRALHPADALDRLRRIDGIGPFSAELVLVRGAGAPDVFPTSERRLHDSMARLYGLTDPGRARLASVAAGWAPYRSWVGVLIRLHRERTTGEIARHTVGARPSPG